MKQKRRIFSGKLKQNQFWIWSVPNLWKNQNDGQIRAVIVWSYSFLFLCSSFAIQFGLVLNGLIYPSLRPKRQFSAAISDQQGVSNSIRTICTERVQRFSTIIQAMDQTIMFCGQPSNNVPGIVNIGACRFSNK